MTTKLIFKTCSHTNVHNSFLLPQIFSLNTKQYKLIKIKKNQADELQKKKQPSNHASSIKNQFSNLAKYTNNAHYITPQTINHLHYIDNFHIKTLTTT